MAQIMLQHSAVRLINFQNTYQGASIYSHSPTHAFGSETYKLLNLPLFKYDREPELVLNRVSEKPTPGLCWPFKSDTGFVTLKLAEPVKINEIVYTHVDKSIEPEHLSKSAPRTIEVWVRVEYYV